MHLGEDIRRQRLDANVSLAAVSRATGISAQHLGRVESGKAHPSIEVLVAVGVALGADMNLRYFPGTGPRIHDRFQAPMTEALLRALHPRWQALLEVPINAPTRGVIDVVLHDCASAIAIAVEVQSDIRRLEQQIRWSHEKALGLRSREMYTSGTERPVSQLLVLRSTVRTRELARRFEAILQAAFPTRTAEAFAALTTTAPWPGSAVVWMHLHGVDATLMRLPPNGVDVGR